MRYETSVDTPFQENNLEFSSLDSDKLRDPIRRILMEKPLNTLVFISAEGGIGKSTLLKKASQRFVEQYKENRENTLYDILEGLYIGSFSQVVSVNNISDVDIGKSFAQESNNQDQLPTNVRALAKLLYESATTHLSHTSAPQRIVNTPPLRTIDLFQAYHNYYWHDEIYTLLVDWYFVDSFRENVRSWIRKTSRHDLRQSRDKNRCRHIFQRMFRRRFGNNRRSRRLLLQHANHSFLMLSGGTTDRGTHLQCHPPGAGKQLPQRGYT